jgi:hypothetical protein
MLTEKQFKEIQSAVDDEKSIGAELADALLDSYKVAARLVNKHHRHITPCFVCGFDPLGTEDFNPDELSRTWEYGITFEEDDWDAYPELVNTYTEENRAQELAEKNKDFILVKREAAGTWRKA